MPLLKDILPGIRAKHGNKSKVAGLIGIKPQQLGQYETGKRNPKAPFYKKWKEVFNEDLESLLNEANASRETKNLTPVPKANDNKEMDNPEQRENIYRTIVEGHTEYLLIPRSVMSEVQLISTKQLEKDKAYMDALIEFNRDLLTKIPNVPKVKNG